MQPKADVYGLVLAGGRSRRMGRDKALLLREDGKTQLEQAVALLEERLERVFVSVRADQNDEVRSKFERIVDRYHDIGPAAGILSALETHPDRSWLVLACDLPNVDGATLDFLLRHRSSTAPATAFRSSHDGLPEPLCAIYTPAARPIVEKFVADGIVCPRKMLIRSATKLLDQPAPAALDNVNTPQDLARAGMRVAS